MLGMLTRLCIVLFLSVEVVATATSVALVGASKNGDVKAIRALLLQANVDVNAPEPDGSTALHWAAHRGDLTAVDLLLRAGARAAVANRYGVTPLSLAAANGNPAVIARLLESGANPNTTVAGGETVLMTAARAGRLEAVRGLVDAGADVNAREVTRGQTALMWAAAEGHTDVIRLLIDRGANLSAVSHPPSSPADITNGVSLNMRRSPRVDVFTALQFAMQAGRGEVIRTLIEAGTDLNDKTPQGMGLLTLAIANAHYDVAVLLVDSGADVNAADVGWSPLHQVVRMRTLAISMFPHPRSDGSTTSFEFAKMLLVRGADVAARTTERFQDGWSSTLRTGATAFLLAAKGADFDMMRLLAANGADVTASNDNGTNAIMAAAGIEMSNPNEDSGLDGDALVALKLAIRLGAGDINAINKDGDTAVHGAIFRQTQENIRVLAEAGAVLDVKNKRGKMAIEDARDGIPLANNSRRTPKPAAAEVLYELMLARGLMPPDYRTPQEHYQYGKKAEQYASQKRD